MFLVGARRGFMFVVLSAALLGACGSSGSAANGGDDAAAGADAGPEASSDAGPGDATAAEASSCGALGATCSGPAACCSNYCKSGICTCNSDGYACHTSADCCAGDCSNGTCGGGKDASGVDGASDAGTTSGLVLCGGGQFFSNPPFPQTTFSDSWVFDGTTWTQVVAMGAACGGQNGAAASLSSEAVAFGGYVVTGSTSYAGGGTETFAGASWNALTAKTTDPVAREGHAMASLGSVVVLFGGNTVTGSGGAYLQETWTFDGSSWTSVTTASSPSGRSGHAMATLGSTVVLFGGADTNGLQSDTWTFDGTTWTPVSTANSPPSRRDGAMATLGSKVYLFGGYNYVTDDAGTPHVVPLGDTWSFDGATWNQITITVAPSARYDHAMAQLNGQIILFGGENTTTNIAPSLASYSNETWAFDGSHWTLLSPSNSPAVRSGHTLAAF